MVRKRTALGGTELASTNGSGRSRSDVGSRSCGFVFWVVVLVAVGAWLIFAAWSLAPDFWATPAGKGPDASAEQIAAEYEATMRSWNATVATMDQQMAGLRQSFSEQAARLEKLSSAQPAGGILPQTWQEQEVQRRLPLLAAGRRAAGASSGLQQAQNTALPSAAVEIMQTLSGGWPGPERAPPATLDSGGCTFEDNLDYQTVGQETLHEQSTPEDCCRLCAEANRAQPGSCAVGVLSSERDVPPLACWLKEQVGNKLRKEGVKACWPSKQEQTERKVHMEAVHEEQVAGQGAGAAPRGVTDLWQRAEAIRDAMRHAWSNYHTYAWGADELRPLSGRPKEGNFRHAVTMVDSLDTLWIMGMRKEFDEAKAWLVEKLPGRIQSMPAAASIFETTIRSLGGLLSAYDLSKDQALLNLAKLLGNKIIAKVGADGVTPYTFAGGHGGMGCRSIAESGTIQLEMAYLSRVTGDMSYSNRVDKFYETIRTHRSVDGLYPNCWLNGRGKITFGADGDSFYEYLLKVWLIKGGGRVVLPAAGEASSLNTSLHEAEGNGDKPFDYLWDMFNAAANGLENKLVRKGPDGLTYLGNLFWSGSPTGTESSDRYEQEMEHLTCFASGWLALGASVADPRAAASRERRMKLAANIAETCYKMYERQPTGIAPERVKAMLMDLSRTDTREYILRPEAAEAWFYMHQLTGDPRYREWGWNVFQNFEKWLRVPHGYASLKDVKSGMRNYLDRMESFFLAETIKYLFLLQDPNNTITLDKYVFNTEAHPFSMNEL